MLLTPPLSGMGKPSSTAGPGPENPATHLARCVHFSGRFRVALPHRVPFLQDMHAGYGFAIGNVAAMDMADPNSVISPGGVGFDINCGVRVIRTNLFEKDILDYKVLGLSRGKGWGWKE